MDRKAKDRKSKGARAGGRPPLEQALWESEALFRPAFETGHIGMVLSDKRYRIVRANAAFCDIVGYSPKEVVSRTFVDFTHPDHIPENRKNIRKLVRGELSVYRAEKRYIRKNGETVWASVSVSAVRDRRGKFLSFLTFIENIDDRKRAEEELRKNEALFRLTFESGPIGMLMCDRHYRIIGANEAFCRIVGYTKEELGARSFTDLTHPDHVLADTESGARLLRGEISEYCTEKRYVKKNGDAVWVSLTVTAVRDGKGKFLYFLTLSENIDERRRAEEALRKSESLFRLTFEENPVGMALVDGNARFMRMNSAYCRITGYSEKELRTRTVFDLTHPDDLGKDREQLEKVWRGETSRFNIEKRYVRKDGETVWVSVTVAAVRDARGNFLHTLGMIENITDRKRAEDALKASEARFRLTFEDNPVGMALVDRALKFIRVNDAFCRIVGYTHGELRDRSVRDVTHPDDYRADRESLEKLQRGEMPLRRVEKRYIAKNGEVVWGSVTITLVRDERGKALYALVVLENITERKRAENALRESEERYRSFFENSIDGVLLTSPDGTIHAANAEACRIFGMTEEEMLRSRREDIVDPGDRMVEFSLKEKERIGRFKGEIRFRRKDGTVFSAEVSTALYKDRNGLTKSTMIIRDVTERKRAERALRESEERYRSIFENAPLGIFHSTIKGKLVSVNPTYARQLGYSSPKEIIAAVNRTSVPRHLYVHPRRHPEFVKRSLALGGWQEYENQYRRKDGEVLTGLLRFRTIPKNPETGAELEGFLEDVTAKKKAEEELRLYQEKLRVLSMQFAFVEEKERQRIANNIHDYIGQSLACIMLDLGALENEIGRNPPALETLRKVRSQVEQSIQQMRSVTAELSPAILFKLGFGAVVEWLADRILEPRGISCRIESETPLKISDSEVSIILYRAVRELLMNIVKHAKARRVRIAMRSDGSLLEMTVRDDGAGFDVLRAAKKTEGFGLFSVREQLAYIGGGMSIESKAGRGTTVRILAPLTAEEKIEGGKRAPGGKA